jgi:uncharacterized membrane protein
MNKLSRYLSIALAISLAVNLFLVGFVTARTLLRSQIREPFQEEPFTRGPFGLFGATEALKNPRPMERLLRDHMQDFKPKREILRAARQRVAQVLATEPFSPESLKKALDDLRKATQESQIAIHNAFVELATSLSPQERLMLSKSRRLLPGDGQHQPPPGR